MQFGFLDETRNDLWDRYVRSHSEGHPFHLSYWKSSLEKAFGFSPVYIYAQDQSGNITGVLPVMEVRSIITGRRLSSLPFSFCCGPLADSPEVVASLLRRAIEVFELGKFSYLEIKSDHDFNLPDVGLVPSMNLYYHYILDLGNSADQLFHLFHPSMIQRAIRKAQREGVEIVTDNSRQALEIFYRMNCLTCKKHGIPPAPLEYFSLLLDSSSSDERVFLHLAKLGGEHISANVYSTFRDRIYYLYGASDEKFHRYRANQLLLWHLAEWGIENGYSYLYLGRASSDNMGLRDYKIRWHSREIPLCYYYYPHVRGVGAVDRGKMKVRFVRSIWKRLPLVIIKRSAFLFKHLA